MRAVSIEDIDNLNFWICYTGGSYPNSYEDEEEVSISELMQEYYTEEVEIWWNRFTGYYEGVLDESDGYLEEPTTLEMPLAQDKILKIEFHPGDILYFINDREIGSTGPHWKLQTIPYREAKQLLALEYGRQLFLLLLPLTVIRKGEEADVFEEIRRQMSSYFSENLCERAARYTITGLMEPDDQTLWEGKETGIMGDMTNEGKL